MSEEIIIDGIDVGKCNFLGVKLTKKYMCTCGDIEFCIDEPNCNYKNWKRKQQECEELRKYHNKCCEEFEKEKKEWLEKYNQVSRDFYDGKHCNKENCNLLKAKEQEYKRLEVEAAQWESAFTLDTKLLDKEEARASKLEQQLDQLKQILAGVEEIARRDYKTEEELFKIRHSRLPKFSMGALKGRHNLASEILQKISECGVENESTEQTLQKISEVSDDN